ncbi:hypothetical protein [Paenibacillus alba]|uniref:Uncharacterized protein n=1 Tax=Paenibacillus alba TaxID=1197127 RepID=A0ABU6GAU2_9BACL|nr:hypothetical protein [Paenibacillus alba]MEC0231307.1 hypothetical protein [Paenibacillus alba]
MERYVWKSLNDNGQNTDQWYRRRDDMLNRAFDEASLEDKAKKSEIRALHGDASIQLLHKLLDTMREVGREAKSK